MRRRLLASLLLSGALLAAAPRPLPSDRIKLVLAIVIDQFRYDYLTRFRGGYSSGLARMLDQGAVFTNAHWEHFPTVTAVGHAAFLTGSIPSINGIVGNEWFDRETGRQVTSVSDPATRLLGAGRDSEGASPRRLQVSTLADELKMSSRGPSRSIGISVKDRSAILPVGRTADGAYWFDSNSGNFVSSSYYFSELPAWVRKFNESRAADRYLGVEWTPSGGGKPFRRMGREPGRAFYDSLSRSPYGNELLEQLAERAIEAEQLGRHPGIDLLAVSFSCNDYVGHGVGPEAAEVRDISIRTDLELGKLFRYVDSVVGMDKVVVVLTADHGVAPLPEVNQARKMPGGRMTEESVLAAIEARLAEKYGEGKWVLGHSGPAPYLNHELIRQKKLSPEEVRQTAAEGARNAAHILRVYTRDQLEHGYVARDFIGRRVMAGYHTRRATDLFIVAEPYWLFEEAGTSHGTPFNYDTHVPVIFLGPGIRPGRYNRQIAAQDIAPTLATLLDVEVPAGASGRPLDEILETH